MGETAPERAKVFVDAVAWGEHLKVWELLSEEGRHTVLRVGAARGMDEGLAARLRDGTAATTEQDEFLVDLVNGLRADLAGNDLDAIEAELDPEGSEPGRARVVLVAPVPEVLNLPGLPVASVDMTEEDGGWRVDRLIPRTSQ
ncbi:MAG: hypothetical protein KY412_07065 [Actinobacteria bacterium]|nr:hypothetical protein [Actinomycetota bacterium]MBW3645724.1 hypothetical protein [Actinomycetota bacterium]